MIKNNDNNIILISLMNLIVEWLKIKNNGNYINRNNNK